MAEIITEEQPRIKYTTHYVGELGNVTAFDPNGELAKLSALMSEMESLGAAPILNDGQVRLAASRRPPFRTAAPEQQHRETHRRGRG